MGTARGEFPVEGVGWAMVETIHEPLLVLTHDLRVELANPAFYRHFRVSPQETLGESIFALGNRQWDTAKLRELFETLIPEHRELSDFEVVHVFPTIGERAMLLNAREIEHEGEGLALILIAFEDVTDRRRAERERERIQRELERSNRELEEFAHAASHDLQEPLRKISAFVDRLLDRLPAEALDERAQLYADRVRAAVARMRQRIDDLLQLGRVGRLPVQHTRIELEDVVSEVLEDLAIENGAVDVGALPGVEADRTQMTLLFQNLLHNAAKYRRADVPLRVELGSEPVPSPEGDERAFVRVWVQDNGIGFEPRYAERIFGAFQRLHGRTEYEGSGVGLAICRRIAELHGGRIDATGVPDEGARFDVFLPLQQPSKET